MGVIKAAIYCCQTANPLAIKEKYRQRIHSKIQPPTMLAKNYFAYRAILSCLIILGLSIKSTVAQNLVAQPDLADAIILCDKRTISIPEFLGPGTDNMEAEGSCRETTPEANTAWFTWEGATDGTLSFTITPSNNNDQLSFVLFRLPDDGSAKVAVRCAIPCTTGAIGLRAGVGGAVIEDCAANPNNGFMSPLIMEPNFRYALMVENASSTEGFTIDFGGDGEILGPTGIITSDKTDFCFGEPLTFDNTVTFDIPNGEITNYLWLIEDDQGLPEASEGGGQVTSPTFDQNFEVGPKLVKLIVSTNTNCQATFELPITISSCCDSDNAVTITKTDSTDIRCAGDSNGALDLAITSKFPILPTWDQTVNSTLDSMPPDNYTISATNLGPDIYKLVVENQAACKDSITHTINASIDLSATHTIEQIPNCSDKTGGAISVQAMGGTMPYRYDFGEGFINDAFANNLDTGDYDIIVIDQNDCTDTIRGIELDEKELEIAFDTTAISCYRAADGQVTISATNNVGDLTFDFGDGQLVDESALSNLDTGRYVIDVFDSEGCFGGPVEFELIEPPVFSVRIDRAVKPCAGKDDGSAIAVPTGGTTPIMYEWSSGQTDMAVDGLPIGQYTVKAIDANGCEVESMPIDLVDPEPLVVAVNSTLDVTCFSNNDGAIELDVSGGQMPYSYSTDGIDFEVGTSIGNLAPGDYDIVVRDNAGCETTLPTETIGSPESISFEVSSTGNICYGETLTFTNTSTFTRGSADVISWDFGDTTAMGAGPHEITFRSIGRPIVTLNITTTENCPAGRTDTIPNLVESCCDSGNGIFFFGDQNDPLCNGETNGFIDLSLEDPIVPITDITWEDGSAGANRENLAAGDYSVTITNDAECKDSTTFTLMEPQPVTVNLDITPPSCGNMADGQIVITASGGTNSDFEYSVESGTGFNFTDTQIADGLLAGDYLVTVRDGNNCTSPTMPAELSEKTLVPDAPLITRPSCFGDSDGTIAFNVPNGTGPFLYDLGDGNGFQDESTALSNLGEGEYNIRIQDAELCLSEIVPVPVTPPDPLSIELLPTNISCFGENDGTVEAVVSGGVGNYTYDWNNGQTDSTAMNLTEGTYSVVAMDGNDCPITSEEVSISEPNELFAAIENIDNVLCFGEMNGAVSVDASGGTGPYQYSLDGIVFQDAATIGNLTAGDYSVIVQDSRGCEQATQSATVDQPGEFTISAEVDRPVAKLGFSINLSATPNTNTNTSINYTWSIPDSVVCTGCQNFETVPPGSTTYTVVAVNGDNCQATASVDVAVSLDRPVYIPNAFSPNGDGVHDEFFIPFSPAMSKIERLQIFDRSGTMVFEVLDINPGEEIFKGWDGEFNGSKLRQGVFVIIADILFVDGLTFPYQSDLMLVTSE